MAASAGISRPSGGCSPRAGRRGRSSASTRTRGGSSPTPCARRRARGDPVIAVSVTRKLARAGLDRLRAQGAFSPSGAAGGRWRRSTCGRCRRCRAAHNHQNACAAYAAARSLGLGPRQIEAGLASYPGLPHRSQLVATLEGRADRQRLARRPTPTRRRRRSASFERIRWIAGGRPKAGGIERAAAAVRAGGEGLPDRRGGGRISRRRSGETPHVVCRHARRRRWRRRSARRRRARRCCWRRPAPASTSSTSFEERGEAFEALVRERIGG